MLPNHEHATAEQIQTFRCTQSGGEPFPEIHKCVPALGLDEGLIVVAPFLPPPLVEKLAGDVYASKLERGAGSDWLVYFWH